MRETRRRLATVLLISLCLTGVSPKPAGGQPRTPTEYELKAAFLYNFAKFVTWPESSFQNPDDAFYLGIIGNDRFKGALDQIQGKKIRGRDLIVRQHKGLEDIRKCQIVFVSKTGKRSLRKLLDIVGQRPILTVSDMEGFARGGGIIAFVEKDRKLRFKINIDAANRAGLKISAKLLQLAEIVRE